MKKTISTLLLLLTQVVMFSSGAFAAFQSDGGNGGVIVPGSITTYTSEPCAFEGGGNGETVTSNPKVPADLAKRYPCTVSAGNGLVEFISELYRFMYFTALIFGVAMIVLAGVFMSMTGAAGEKAKEFGKKWIPKILFGIMWLLFIPFVLKTMAPFFFQ